MADDIGIATKMVAIPVCSEDVDLGPSKLNPNAPVFELPVSNIVADNLEALHVKF